MEFYSDFAEKIAKQVNALSAISSTDAKFQTMMINQAAQSVLTIQNALYPYEEITQAHADIINRLSVPISVVSDASIVIETQLAATAVVQRYATTFESLAKKDFRIGVAGQKLVDDLSFLYDKFSDTQQLDIDHFENELDKESSELFANETNQNCNHADDIREIKQMISHLYFENTINHEEQAVNKNRKVANEYDDPVETQHKILTFINICALILGVLKYSQDIYELIEWIQEMIQILFQ
ncbi:hypothetical protein [Enterococcus mundtii]|uniref:Uncharacterized protein n=1 Tax=Enterococcus mundtii TaxID=53346 RepID=A0A1V2UH49_ENTMU|nr:hypothetical protein [Enterococcus mundtii]ONN42671.1 hypothetical protein BTN92_10410 [Enterococcus mundtii]